MSKEIDVRRCAHPYVRSKGPSLRPDHLSLVQGGGWRSSMADGHREAAPSVLEGHPPPCDAGDRRALGPTSASHDPYRHREAEVGSPSKSGTAIPSIFVLMLNHVMLSAVPSSGRVNTMIRINGIGDRDRP